MKRYYWDACAWIALINEEPGRYDNCQWIIDEASRGNIQIFTSSLSLVEVLKTKCSGEYKEIEEQREKAFEDFLEQDFVYEVFLDNEIGKLARSLIRKYDKLKKPNDGIHLATAVHYDVDELHTYDWDDLIPLDGSVFRKDRSLLKIREIPPIPSGGLSDEADLFDKTDVGDADAKTQS